jgi:lycopene cyclase domain-containing protein
MSYYGWILLGTLAAPLLLSFDKRIAFYKDFKNFSIATLIVAVLFVFWDQQFTRLDVWGFNKDYVGSVFFFGLPLEELLFFIVVPYSCLFVYQVIKGYFKDSHFVFYGKIFGFATALSAIILAMAHMRQWYTLCAASWSAIVVIGLCFQAKVKWFGKFAVSFTVCLIPFLIVNGLLTGIATPEPVVSYNEEHIIGIRILTIPIEDIYYNLGFMLPIVAIFELLQAKKTPRL